MPDHANAGVFPAATASAPVFVATFAALLVLTLVFLALDIAIARIDRRESALHAAHLFDEGKHLLTGGSAHEAANRFASALAIQRDNTAYAVMRSLQP